MGYMRHKYTRTYFLKEDVLGNKTVFGAEGVEDFKRGSIRRHDWDILRHIDFRGKNVLDVGFGRGEAIKYALEHGARTVVGVDFSEDAHLIAREFLANYGLRADVYCMDALRFLESYASQKDAEAFEIVLMLDVMEHIPRSELTNVFRLMRNLLSDRAALAINTPVFRVDNDVIAHGLDPRGTDAGDEFEETAGMHCNRYTTVSLRNYMRNCGFTAVSGHFFVPNLSIARNLEGTSWARWIAIKRGYPLSRSIMWQRARLEHAMSWDDIRSSRNSMRQKLRWTIKNRLPTLLSLAVRLSKHMAFAVPRLLLGYYRAKDCGKRGKGHFSE